MKSEANRSRRIVIILLVCVFLFLVSATAASRLVIPNWIEGECAELFGVPASVKRAGINFVGTSFWIEDFALGNVAGAQERTFLSFKKMVIQFSFTSLFARQLIVDKIRFEEPILNLERDAVGVLNASRLESHLKDRFRPRIKFGRQYFFTGYELHHFSVKKGIFRYATYADAKTVKRWRVHHIDLSFSHFSYPPQLIDPVSTSIYVNAKMEGVREASLLVLGRGNFLSGKKDFRIRCDLNDVPLRELNSFFPELPVLLADGFLDLKSELQSKGDRFTLTNGASLEGLRIVEKPGFGKEKVVFGHPKKDVIDLFQKMEGRSFGFDYAVSGNLNDPNFHLGKSFKEKMEKAIEARLAQAFARLKENQLPFDERSVSLATPRSSLREAFEEWTGIKIQKKK